MPKFLVLVMSNPSEGMEEEFNDWYEHTHLDEVLATTNFSWAQRFVLDEASEILRTGKPRFGVGPGLGGSLRPAISPPEIA